MTVAELIIKLQEVKDNTQNVIFNSRHGRDEEIKFVTQDHDKVIVISSYDLEAE